MLPPLPRARQPHDLVLRAARRHPFFLAALALHAVVLWGLSHLHSSGLEQAALQLNQAQIQTHTAAAQQQGMRRRVDSLKAMQSLMERIERAQAESAEPLDEARPPEPVASAAAGPAATPQEMLAQARDLRDRIQRLEQAAQARKMAELLKLSPGQALEKVKQQAAEAARREGPADVASPGSAEQVMQALSRYEQQARESLQRLQAQREQERHGTRTGAGGAAGAAHAGGGSGADGAGTAVAGGAGGGGGAQGGLSAGGGLGGGTGASGGPGGSADGGAGRPDGRVTGVRDVEPRRYEGRQRSPFVDTAQLRLGGGNTLGPGGTWANRVYVDRWYVIGPFHAANATSLNRMYPPEQWVDLDGVYRGKGQRVLRWQYVSSASYPLIPPDAAEQAIYYGYTEIVSDRARRVQLALGADDDARLWLNDQLVWTSGNQRKAWYTDGGVQSLKQDIRTYNLIEERLQVTLRKGLNTVLFKLYNNPLDVFFALSIEPVDGGG